MAEAAITEVRQIQMDLPRAAESHGEPELRFWPSPAEMRVAGWLAISKLGHGTLLDRGNRYRF